MSNPDNKTGEAGRNVAANVRRLRDDRMRWSYTDLSRALTAAGRSINPESVRRIEVGERRVDVDDLVALATVLDVSPLDLLMPPGPAGMNLVTSADLLGEVVAELDALRAAVKAAGIEVPDGNR